MTDSERTSKSRRRKLGALLTLLAAVVAIWAVTYGMLKNASGPKGAVEQKVADANRLLFYEIGPEHAAVFSIDAGTTSLKIATHLLLPPGAPYDPEKRYDYGVRVTYKDADGKVLFQRELSARTRQSKAGPGPDGWMQENAFSPNPGEELTDRRDFDLDLPPGLPRGTLHVEPTGKEKVLVRVLTPEESNEIEREAKLLSLPSADDGERVGSLTYTPWELLRKEERAAIVDKSWKAVPAEGEAKKDHAPHVVYYSGFRLPIEGAEAGAALNLSADHHLALNVTGASRVKLHVARPPGQAGRGPETIEVESIHDGNPIGPWKIQLAEGKDSAVKELELPSGLRTLALRTQSEEGLLVHATRAPLACTGKCAPKPLVPEERQLTPFTADASSKPLTYELGEPIDLASRMLRFEVRALEATEKVRVELTLLDAQGKVVTRSEQPVAADAAPFERLATATTADGKKVHEPGSFRYIVPPAARTLEVRTSVVSAVQVSVASSLTPSRLKLAPPYDQLKSDHVRWRYAPIVEEGWSELRPLDHRELTKAGRQATIAAQVRLERTGGGVPTLAGAFPLEPRGAIERQTILERVHGSRQAALVEGWDGQSFTELKPNAPVALEFPAKFPTRPQLRFWLPETARGALGTPVEVVTDGEADSVDLRTTRGRALLAPLAPGRHIVELKTPTSEARLFVNRPPAKGAKADLFRVRTVHALGPQPLAVTVKKRGTAPVKVFAVVYGASEGSTEAQLTARIDGGNPRRVSGVAVTRLTNAEREILLPAARNEAAAMFMNHDSGGELSSRFFSVTLGEDVAPGNHEVTIARGKGGDLWFRFFSTAPGEPAEEEFESWTQEGWAMARDPQETQ